MKVLYDHQAFLKHYSGVSKSFCELISHLPSDIDPFIAVKESRNLHLIDSGLVPELKTDGVDVTEIRKRIHIKGVAKAYLILNRLGLLHKSEYINLKYAIDNLNGQQFDLFHPTFFNQYFLKYLGQKPFVLTIHDMMPELYPQYYGKNDMQIIAKKELVKKAGHIIAVSENTKKDIVNILGVSPERITVIYHGGPKPYCNKGQRLYDFQYFLYVGSRSGYKNFGTMLDAFGAFHEKHKEVRLVCTGPSFDASERNIMSQKKLTDFVIHRYVNDEELQILYSGAIAFIYPSLYEGFGMPILEAFAAQCPVILSNASCFPEIAGNAALFFDTNNGVDDLEAKLSTVYDWNEEERNNAINRGLTRLSSFSWQDSAALLANVYKKVV